jgi:uncharacterized protein (TIGR00369 family)
MAKISEKHGRDRKGKSPAGLAAVSKSAHPRCIVCGTRCGGMCMRFQEQPDRSVVGVFSCESEYQGYPGRLHGGVVATLLDAAMTHCLFARGASGVTAKLNIRYRRPVLLGTEAVVRAWLVDRRLQVFVLKADLEQQGRLCATGEGHFLVAS